MELINHCICENKKFESGIVNKIEVRKCLKCGLYHQKVKDIDLKAYYKDYNVKEYGKSYSHNLAIAKIRFSDLGLEKPRLLDIGSSDQAFVDYARERGYEAYGNDICIHNENLEHTYFTELEKINFPTDYFDILTCQDVLEHLTNPAKVLKESFRILKQKGEIIIDIPDFWDKNNSKHHWKKTQHLWFFKENDIVNLLEETGFQNIEIWKPIPSKICFKAKKPIQKRTKILVPPGIGDIYWTLVKLESFIEKNNLGLPDVYISSSITDRSKDRSIDYLRMHPFLNAVGYIPHDHKGQIWKEAYFENKRNVFLNVLDCDYFIALNGSLRFNKTLDNIMPEYKNNWYPPMFESLHQVKYGKKFRDQTGPYVIIYFLEHGMYKKWLHEFPERRCLNTLKKLIEMKYKIVLVGAKWDKDQSIVKSMSQYDKNNIINMIDKTSIDEVFGIIKYSDGVIGFPSGLTIMSTVFKIPTIMLWNDYFCKTFWHCSCPPDSLGVWYDIFDTKEAKTYMITDKLRELQNNVKAMREIDETLK